MNRRGIFLIFAAAVAMTACDEQVRNGQLTLDGSAPLRIADQAGGTVDFYSGPLKVEFSPEGGRTVGVKLEQGGRIARFTAKVSRTDWNFSVKGSEIGQPVDLVSERKVELYGPIYARTGTGGPCGFNGTYVTEERWQSGNEDWSVSFADAGTAQPVGVFKSRLEGVSYLIDSRLLWCRERPQHEFPRHERHTRFDRISTQLDGMQGAAVAFDGR